MFIEQLDSEIFIYRKPTNESFMEYINMLENIFIDKNVWEVSSKFNILDTDIVTNKKCTYLKDNYFDKKETKNKVNLDNSYNKIIYNLKEKLLEHSFESIMHFIKYFDINSNKIKTWTVFCQNKETDFHFNQDRNKEKNNYVLLISLNDALGGEIEFKDRIGKEKIYMSKGDILIYPASSNYMHKEHASIVESKYYAVTYF